MVGEGVPSTNNARGRKLRQINVISCERTPEQGLDGVEGQFTCHSARRWMQVTVTIYRDWPLFRVWLMPMFDSAWRLSTWKMAKWSTDVIQVASRLGWRSRDTAIPRLHGRCLYCITMSTLYNCLNDNTLLFSLALFPFMSFWRRSFR